MTNDFVALLKDSSLVSVITVIELTKQTLDFRREHRELGHPRILCARSNLVLSLPLSRLRDGWRTGGGGHRMSISRSITSAWPRRSRNLRA